jgi:hypothetical protein
MPKVGCSNFLPHGLISSPADLGQDELEHRPLVDEQDHPQSLEVLVIVLDLGCSAGGNERLAIPDHIPLIVHSLKRAGVEIDPARERRPRLNRVVIRHWPRVPMRSLTDQPRIGLCSYCSTSTSASRGPNRPAASMA